MFAKRGMWVKGWQALSFGPITPDGTSRFSQAVKYWLSLLADLLFHTISQLALSSHASHSHPFSPWLPFVIPTGSVDKLWHCHTLITTFWRIFRFSFFSPPPPHIHTHTHTHTHTQTHYFIFPSSPTFCFHKWLFLILNNQFSVLKKINNLVLFSNNSFIQEWIVINFQ